MNFFDCLAVNKEDDLKPLVEVLTQEGCPIRIKDYYSEDILNTYQEAYDDMVKRGKRYQIGSEDVGGAIFGYDTNNVIFGSPTVYQYKGLNLHSNGIIIEMWEPLDYVKLHGLGGVFSTSYEKDTFKDERINNQTKDLLEVAKKVYPLARPAIGFVGELIFPDNTPKVFKTERRIPRVWWANFYGPLYVKKYGKDFLLDAPGYITEELDDGGIFYQITEDFYIWEDSDQGPAIEEVEGYFKNHSLIKHIRYRPILAKDFLPRRHPANRP